MHECNQLGLSRSAGSTWREDAASLGRLYPRHIRNGCGDFLNWLSRARLEVKTSDGQRGQREAGDAPAPELAKSV